MSSWLLPSSRRMPALLLALTLGCERKEPAERPQPAASALPPAPPPAPKPWFQGEWHGGGTPSVERAVEQKAPGEPERSGLLEAPVTVHLLIDESGGALGSSSLDSSFRGVVDGDTVRLEAEGPGGHGVVVLHRQTDALRGVLHYAPRGADQGQEVSLTLSRAEAP